MHLQMAGAQEILENCLFIYFLKPDTSFFLIAFNFIGSESGIWSLTSKSDGILNGPSMLAFPPLFPEYWQLSLNTKRVYAKTKVTSNSGQETSAK